MYIQKYNKQRKKPRARKRLAANKGRGKRYCSATFKTKQNERGEGNRMKIWKEYTLYAKVKRNVGRSVGLSRVATVRKYNLHSQVAELLSAADVRNHIRWLLCNHTVVLYWPRFLLHFSPLNGFLQYFGGSFLFIRSVIELFRFISHSLLYSTSISHFLWVCSQIKIKRLDTMT